MLKVLIADCSEDFRTALAAALTSRFQITCCRTGTEAWELLHQDPPHILVLDLMLPELDGLTLLERTRNDGIRPLVLAATPIFSEYVYSCAQRLSISYLVRKPCDIDALASRVTDLSQRLTEPQPRIDPVNYVTEQLLSLGFSTKHNGFSYLREAIILMSMDPAQSVTKILYPSVAHTFSCQKENVERSIRTAMDSAWERGNPLLWSKYFPDASQRPSNAVFITRISDALLREE